ncbi:hypothetical protein HHL17_21165 [Chitinophaga sp. G-6-1-13]|uniref:Uncharacterized protein n=1 Tax=Chitinophaga fulva TaxID=2728842 RepID=A0A848GSL7_9BACT|nr:hypothetical protein [Chitinophaga fulva]NML39723.1 hypothetical protein [Chitinophaga fulva]
MEERFYIDVHFKVSKGWITYAKINLGDDQEFANSLFEMLAGRTLPEGFLRMNLMESKNDLALLHNGMYCTLPELAENCTFITKEVFRFYNLDKGY